MGERDRESGRADPVSAYVLYANNGPTQPISLPQSPSI
jgi:hypothetical protein